MVSKRIFIENLPEAVTDPEIQNKFTKYGEVKLIEIKERKVVTHKHSSRFYAYVNIETDEHSLQKCFQDFRNQAWHGQYLKLQIAKESFLEKLKKERESILLKKEIENSSEVKIVPCETNYKQSVNDQGIRNGLVFSDEIKQRKRKVSSDSLSSDSSIHETTVSKTLKKTVPVVNDIQVEDKDSEIIFKNNKGKVLNGRLEIEGVGKEPVLRIEKKTNKLRSLDKFRSQANHKRIDSLLEKRKAYSQQKHAIQAALSNSNSKTMNKKIFSENEEEGNDNSQTKETFGEDNKSKKPLFEESDSDGEDHSGTFEIKEMFQGKGSLELMKLQSSYKNDERFKLNQNFLDDDQAEQACEPDVDVEEEKKKELEILENILGYEVKSKLKTPHQNHIRNENEIQSMRRFDPAQPDHEKYEIKRKEEKIPKTRKESVVVDKKVDQKEEPKVSKEVFYAVEKDLKNSLETDKGFSLLSMFGTVEQKEETAVEDTMQPIKEKKYSMNDNNPFKYDSSDDEDQTEQIVPKQKASVKTATSIKSWSEPLFFQEDDFRLQEGMDFVKRIATEDQDNFTEVRRNLKQIARNKVRKVISKNQPFRKKLGGNKRKKVRRMNKALSR